MLTLRIFMLWMLLLAVWPNQSTNMLLAYGPMPQLDESLAAAEQKRIAVIDRAKKTGVCIFSKDGNGGGSGVVISPQGHAITNFHVIQSCGSFMKCSMADGVLYDAVIVGIDPVGDVAMIQLLGRNDFPYSELADSDQVRQGDMCFAVGNPFLLATDFQPTVSWGIVSGTHRYQYPAGTLLEYTDCIQTDAAINPGNSGGPLFSSAGKIIGINGRGSFEKRGRVNVGVGYAISSNQVRHFVDHLKSGRILDHATADFTVTTDATGRVRVDNILEASTAYRAGVRIDDELIEFAGRQISTVNQFKNVLGIYPKGFRVSATFRKSKQGGELVESRTRKVFIELSGVHDQRELIEMVAGKMKTQPSVPGIPIPQPKQDQKLDTSMHLSREGFVNYRFNRVHLERVWEKFAGRPTDEVSADLSAWRLICRDEDDKEVMVVLNDQQSGYRSESVTVVLDPDRESLQQLVPEGSGGLLLALQQWRKLMLNGPRKIGDSIYVGSLPATTFGEADQGQANEEKQIMVEQLTTIADGMEFRWLFETSTDPAMTPISGNMVAMELIPEPDAVPCQVFFSNYRRDRGVPYPGTLIYRFDDGPAVKLTIERIELLEVDGGE